VVSDGDSLHDLFVREYGGLVRTAYLVCGDLGRAEEITQEAFARAAARWRRVGRYDRPGAWLRLVVVRLAVRAKQRQSREGSEIPDVATMDATPPDPTIVAALLGLPRDQRVCIVLHHIEDMTVDDIAEALRMRPGTVRSHLHRGRQSLARLLTEREVDRRG
jgi:RNA polymerase sigma-70 factor, ECF subfamily